VHWAPGIPTPSFGRNDRHTPGETRRGIAEPYPATGSHPSDRHVPSAEDSAGRNVSGGINDCAHDDRFAGRAQSGPASPGNGHNPVFYDAKTSWRSSRIDFAVNRSNSWRFQPKWPKARPTHLIRWATRPRIFDPLGSKPRQCSLVKTNQDRPFRDNHDHKSAACRALAARNYDSLTEVQTACWRRPPTRDLLVSAQTGIRQDRAYGLAIAKNLLGESERSNGPARRWR